MLSVARSKSTPDSTSSAIFLASCSDAHGSILIVRSRPSMISTNHFTPAFIFCSAVSYFTRQAPARQAREPCWFHFTIRPPSFRGKANKMGSQSAQPSAPVILHPSSFLPTTPSTASPPTSAASSPPGSAAHPPHHPRPRPLHRHPPSARLPANSNHVATPATSQSAANSREQSPAQIYPLHLPLGVNKLYA